MRTWLCLLPLLLHCVGVYADASGCDVDNGRKVFGQCGVCHSLEPDIHMLGPSLAGVVGRPVAAAQGFLYSPALQQLNLTWDFDTLDAFLVSPMTFVPGTAMAYGGLSDAQARADVICLIMQE